MSYSQVDLEKEAGRKYLLSYIFLLHEGASEGSLAILKEKVNETLI